jgi:phosphoglycerate dehydrogenase-like enzyme
LPSDSEFYTIDNIFISCHSADITEDYFDFSVKVFEDNLKAYLENKKLVTIVDKTKGY